MLCGGYGKNPLTGEPCPGCADCQPRPAPVTDTEHQELPVRQHPVDTRVAAFKARDTSVKDQILDLIETQGEHGATCDEVEVILDLSHQTASATINGLMRVKTIRDSGNRRLTRLGRWAKVWVASYQGP